ncbi:cytochrome P450 [Nocardia sp. CA2R105]|uniref:cytochrome P450 n=1 Tax=Nocardia coffeae TaxID=2873381 RepID=UPI001CA6CD4A|nr:cytochrome P450 [Nocardia coffeae]MBY8857383.1 cytochrome P450 [Nocardia coffeae]
MTGVLDPFSPELRADPAPAYRSLRAVGRLHEFRPGIHLVPHYTDCDAVFGDPAFGHGYFSGINPFRPGVDPRTLPGSFLLMDPPEHTRLRASVAPAFTARAIAALRERITETAATLLDRAVAAGEVDFVTDVAYPLPLNTICTMLGVPTADHARFGVWAAAISRGLDPDALLSDEEKHARVDAVGAFAEYFADLIERRRAEPGADLLSTLATRTALELSELVDMAVLLLIAGHETTMNLIATGLLALARHPDQREILRAEPESARHAVEEFLRFDTPVPFPTRVALREVEFAGRTLPRGTGLILLVGSANRDPEAFTDPDSLDVLRFAPGRGTPRHLAFSHGPHFCVGAPLARLQSEVLFTELLCRAPDFELLDPAPSFRNSVSMRGPLSLPVRLRA